MAQQTSVEEFIDGISSILSGKSKKNDQTSKVDLIRKLTRDANSILKDCSGLFIPTIPEILSGGAQPLAVAALAQKKFACFQHGQEWHETLKRMDPNSNKHPGLQLCMAARIEKQLYGTTKTEEELKAKNVQSRISRAQEVEAHLALAMAFAGTYRYTPQETEPARIEAEVRALVQHMTSGEGELPSQLRTGFLATEVFVVVAKPDWSYLDSLHLRTYVAANLGKVLLEVVPTEVPDGTGAFRKQTQKEVKLAQYRELASGFERSLERLFKVNTSAREARALALKQQREKKPPQLAMPATASTSK